MPVAAALGVKRRCLSCAAPFFDLNRSPIACPKCGAAFEVVELPRHPPGMRARARIPMPAEPVAAEDNAPAAADADADDEASDENDIPEVEDEDETDLDSIVDIERDDSTPKS